MGCEERPFFLKGTLMGCKELLGLGFGLRELGLEGLKSSAFAKTGAKCHRLSCLLSSCGT